MDGAASVVSTVVFSSSGVATSGTGGSACSSTTGVGITTGVGAAVSTGGTG